MNTISWKRVVFSFEFIDDGICPECAQCDGECECPGPNSETSDGVPFEFIEQDGQLWAKPPEGYGWSGEKFAA